jgi:hypothetical protein
VEKEIENFQGFFFQFKPFKNVHKFGFCSHEPKKAKRCVKKTNLAIFL